MRKLLLLLLALIAPSAFARTLHWSSLDVRANLQNDGALHVIERQAMVFDGDWNGGERTFRIRLSQKLDFNGIARVDENGHEVPLKRGDLKRVDQYKWATSSVLRWRSRLPSDPSFENKEIIYVLDYRVRNVLQKTADGRYLLDHDFAFPDREGPIDKYTLNLTFDSGWSEAPLYVERQNLAPGQSVVITRQLTFSGASAPSAFVPIHPSIGRAAAGAMIAAMTVLIFLFLRAEGPTGRFAPTAGAEQINEQWLRTHLLSMKPEVAGAAWDGQTGASEVAAVLARLTSEGKITSRVEKKTLHMHLNQPIEQFSGYERALLAGMFFDGSDTDTNRIRNYYKNRGFDPSKLISGGIDSQLNHIPDRRKRVKRFDWRIILVILAVLANVVLMALQRSTGDLVAAAVTGGLLVFFGAFASGAASYNSSALSGIVWRIVVVAIVFLPAFAAALVCCILASTFGIGPFTVGGIALLAILCWKVVLDAMKIRETPAYIAYRKQLVAAREYFIAQLRSPQPTLRDDWLPYLLAFGLGSNVDRWFRSYGSSGTTSTFASSHTSSSSGTSSTGSAPSWTGGGGAFGGAGATGTWALAAGALAAGVSAPSSSSGGGGGGGGGSSGGGGGGGW